MQSGGGHVILAPVGGSAAQQSANGFECPVLAVGFERAFVQVVDGSLSGPVCKARVGTKLEHEAYGGDIKIDRRTHEGREPVQRIGAVPVRSRLVQRSEDTRRPGVHEHQRA